MGSEKCRGRGIMSDPLVPFPPYSSMLVSPPSTSQREEPVTSLPVEVEPFFSWKPEHGSCRSMSDFRPRGVADLTQLLDLPELTSCSRKVERESNDSSRVECRQSHRTRRRKRSEKERERFRVQISTAGQQGLPQFPRVRCFRRYLTARHVVI